MNERRPLSPNIQHYRPQLTSVLSIVNRITGVLLVLAALALVAGLWAMADGPQGYEAFRAALASAPGQVFMVLITFAFFVHLCGGVRHLFWDAGRGFELGTIYASGWAVVVVSMLLTAMVWVGAWLLAD